MAHRIKFSICSMALVLAFSAWAVAQNSPTAAQEPSPSKGEPHQKAGDSGRISPHETTDGLVNGQKITIEYGRPSMKGRKIVGGLVPYGKVWRTGADEATTLTTPIPLTIGDAHVPAGTYTLYTLPSEGTWKLIISKETGQWGTVYHEAKDLARVDMKKSEITVPVEEFTIAFDQVSNDTTDLVLEWEKTRLTVPVKADK